METHPNERHLRHARQTSTARQGRPGGPVEPGKSTTSGVLRKSGSAPFRTLGSGAISEQPGRLQEPFQRIRNRVQGRGCKKRGERALPDNDPHRATEAIRSGVRVEGRVVDIAVDMDPLQHPLDVLLGSGRERFVTGGFREKEQRPRDPHVVGVALAEVVVTARPSAVLVLHFDEPSARGDSRVEKTRRPGGAVGVDEAEEDLTRVEDAGPPLAAGYAAPERTVRRLQSEQPSRHSQPAVREVRATRVPRVGEKGRDDVAGRLGVGLRPSLQERVAPGEARVGTLVLCRAQPPHRCGELRLDSLWRESFHADWLCALLRVGAIAGGCNPHAARTVAPDLAASIAWTSSSAIERQEYRRTNVRRSSRAASVSSSAAARIAAGNWSRDATSTTPANSAMSSAGVDTTGTPTAKYS